MGFVLGGVVRGSLCWAQILQVRNSPVLITSTLIIGIIFNNTYYYYCCYYFLYIFIY